ncbi:MAG: DUF3106 domain-containing protein [Cocleimonas sp.]|nr:DUF3106 domain-containing protein [Cocleimonas sp.]
MKKLLLKHLLFLSLSLFSLNSLGSPWSQLPVETQKTLKPYQTKWEKLTDTQRKKLIDSSKNWTKMTPKQKKQRMELKKRLKSWKGMKINDRQHAKHWFNWYQQQPMKIKKRILSRKKWFQSLTKGEQREVRHRWQAYTKDHNK